MGWKEELKKILNLPEDAQIITKPYYRKIPKKTGKMYKALTLQYISNGKKKYKHINKNQEVLIKSILSGEEVLFDYLTSKVKEIKDILEKVEDPNLAKRITPLKKEIDRLLMKLSTKIF